MYDISQLNDMVVPELQDIAEQLAIPNYKKLDKQDLIYKILDNQSTMSAETKGSQEEKPKTYIITCAKRRVDIKVTKMKRNLADWFYETFYGK